MASSNPSEKTKDAGFSRGTGGGVGVGAGVGAGVGLGVGFGVGLGAGFGFGEGVGFGDGDGEGETDGPCEACLVIWPSSLPRLAGSEQPLPKIMAAKVAISITVTIRKVSPYIKFYNRRNLVSRMFSSDNRYVVWRILCSILRLRANFKRFLPSYNERHRRQPSR